MATVRLTDKSAAAAKAREGQRLELWDSDVRGLCLRVSDSSKNWVFRYRRPDGTQPRFKIGTYADKDPALDADVDDDAEVSSVKPLTLAQARRRARKLRVVVEDGGDPAGERRRKRATARSEPIRTMQELADAYFTACELGDYTPRRKRKRASTMTEERGMWRRHFKGSDLAALRVEDVSSDAIRKLLRTLVKEGKDTTANRARALARQMFNFAISEGRTDRNPVTQIAVRPEKPRARVLRDGEIKSLWGGLDDPAGLTLPAKEGEKPGKLYVGECVRIALKLLALTLTRRAEVAGMRVDELDLAQGAWVIAGPRTKAGRPHLVPLSDAAIKLVKRAIEIADEDQEEPSAFVFPSPRDRAKAITPGALSHGMGKLTTALGLGDAHTHDLRRTAATIMASERLGVSPFIIGRLLDHASETGGAASVTLAHYALYDYAAEKRSALEGWARLLGDITD